MIGRIVFLAAAIFSGAAHAKSRPSEPIGNWTLDSTSSECLLVRSYGSTKDPLFLVLSEAPMGGGQRIRVVYYRHRAAIRRGTARVAFGSEAPTSADFGALLLRNRSRELKVESLRTVTIESEDDAIRFDKAAEAVSIEAPGEIEASFPLPDNARALDALRGCSRKLGVKWGYPVEEQERLAKAAKSIDRLSSYFSEDDYPPAALKNGIKGRAQLKISISKEGDPSGCEVLASTGSPDLDSASCKVIQTRARFNPAIDVEGRPTRSIAVTTIYWILMN